jgi:hypothetical protein
MSDAAVTVTQSPALALLGRTVAPSVSSTTLWLHGLTSQVQATTRTVGRHDAGEHCAQDRSPAPTSSENPSLS